MKKVLMIARVFPPFQPVGHSIRVIKFIKYLPAQGWLPTVLTIDDHTEYETMRKLGSHALLREIQPDVKVHRTAAGEPSLQFLDKERQFGCRSRPAAALVRIVGGARRWAYRNVILPDRYLTWLPSAVACGRKLLKAEEIDIVFATCPPHSACLVGATLKLLTGKRLVLDYRDDWIGTPWYQSKPRIRRMIEQLMEHWVVGMADKVVLVTDRSKNAFLARYPTEPADKFALIPNGCDLEELAELGSMPLMPRKSKFVIVHTGSLNESMNWGRSASGFFQAVHGILQQMPHMAEEISVVFAGDLPQGHRRLVEELGLSNVLEWVGHLPHNEALRLIKSADLLLAINYEGWSTIIPGKIYEYWAAGGPPTLLLSCPGAASDLVEHYDLGMTVDPCDVIGIRQAILDVYSKSKTSTPWRVSSAGIDAYDRKSLTRELALVLDGLA